jgi:hypothetical protein
VTAIAAAHGATLNARPLPAGGLAVYVQFPACPTGQPPAREPAALTARSPGPA